jgi:hypothetical protein
MHIGLYMHSIKNDLITAAQLYRRALVTTFSKVFDIVTFYSAYTRALTFENLVYLTCT